MAPETATDVTMSKYNLSLKNSSILSSARLATRIFFPEDLAHKNIFMLKRSRFYHGQPIWSNKKALDIKL